MSAPAPGGSPSPPADSPVPPPPSTGTPASPPPSSAPPPAPSPPSSSTPDPPPPSSTPASPPPSSAPPAPSPSSRSTPDPSPSAPPAVPAAPPQKPAPPPVTPATPPASSPPPQAPVTPAAPPVSSPPPLAPVTPAPPPASSPPPQAPVMPAAPPAPVMPAAPPAPVMPAAPPASSPPPQAPVTPADPPASSPPPQPPAAPPPPPAAPLPAPLPPPPVTPAPSTPSPSPPVTPAPSTPSPSPPVTPAPSTPSPSPPAPAAPSPPSPVTPAPPTPSPPSPVKPTPPTPSPPSPVTPAPPTQSPPSPVTPAPPTPPPPSPAGPEPTTPPSPVPPVAPPPTTPSPSPPDAPAAPIPSPTPPSTAPPSPPTPAPSGVSPSPPSGAPPSPPSPPSHSTPSRSPPSVSPPSLSSSSSPSSSPSPSTPSGTVIGVAVAVAVVVVLGLVAGLIYFCAGKRRHRHRRRPPPGDLYDPGLPVTSHQQSHPRPTSAPLSATPPVYSPQVLTSWQISGGSDPTPRSPAVTGGTVSYDDLAAATGGFSDANLLGQGGFGHVYRGTLGGQEVAIKKLRPGSGQGDREFRAEVEIISRVHHRHLVSLVGYCIYGDQRLLVYEYVPNKTLEFHLHGSGRPTLDWTRRWKIALGSAKGLAYLHEDCHPKIIHRDIKAANILLDYNFEPKVADFGLAKIQPGDDTHVSTRVVGTFGYLAPEYATTGKVNDRSDVFSFGVVLLELISGRRPVMSSEPYNDETLVSWARPLLTKALEEEIFDELIDPELDAGYDAYDMQRLIACAAAAVRHTARSRPRMSQIVRYLEGELSIEDLNAGVAPGQSAMQSSGGTTEQMRRLRRMAFLTGTGTITENTSSSFLSEPTSEYGLYPSSSSSGGDTGEVDTQRMSRPHTGSSTASAEGTGPHSGEAIAAERMSRRTRPARAALP